MKYIILKWYDKTRFASYALRVATYELKAEKHGLKVKNTS